MSYNHRIKLKIMSKAIEIWQDNILTNARYEMTETEKNLLYMVVASVRPDDPPSKLYQISVKEMAHISNQPEVKFEAYKQASRRLMTRVVETTLENGDFLQTTFIASALYKSGKGIIEIELSQRIKPFYVNLHSKFTKIQLAASISLKSAYAKRIYELLCQYKNMPNKVFKKDLLGLKTMLCIVDPKTGKDSYAKWTHFEKAILAVASREINEHTELSFAYKPVMGDRPGRGRKPVVAVEFSVLYQAKTEFASISSLPELHERLVKKFKLRKDQATAVIEKFTLEEIHKQLYNIEIKAADGSVRSIGSYTATVFGLATKPTKGKGN